MKRKGLAAGIIIVCALVVFAVLFFMNNVAGQKTEKKVVGQWTVIEDNTGCETDLENGIRINEDGTIEGVEGFKEYQVEETDKEFDYLVLGGGYEDITRYEVNFDEQELLVMKEENVSEALTCYFEKVE